MIDIVVLPMGLQSPSAPSVLSLTPPLGTPCSVQWLAARIHLFICKALAGTLRRQLYQAPFNKHFLASTIVSGLGDYIWDESPGGTSPWMIFPSISALHFISIFTPVSILFTFSENQSIHTFVFLLLELHMVCELYFGAFGLISTYR